jgi:prefoldin subunit 5
MSTELLMIISNGLTGIVAWIVGRRRVQVEVENQVLKNLELSISLYKDIIDSLKKEIHDLNIKIQDLENKIEELIKENHELKGYGKGL